MKLTHFVLLLSFVNFLLFHYPFFSYVVNNIDYKSFNGILAIVSLIILMMVLNTFIFFLIFQLSSYFGKFILTVFFIINAVAVYFINAYGVIIDESMVGNVINTNFEESSNFFSIKLFIYILVGILLSIYIIKAQINKMPVGQFLSISALSLAIIIVLVFANASNWLWIDKNSKQLGGLAMPWSYTVNLSRFYIHQKNENEKAILLPDAKIKDKKKSVVVLVIGESARKQNFSLYGYSKNTNPLLSKVSNLTHFDATSCATYTTAGLKCILEHSNSNDLYEILPNYLYRSDVEVVWRTTNWGEPPVPIKNYQTKADLMVDCKGKDCDYDEVLLTGLKDQILSSAKDKILIILHTNTSHGPSYNKKYPAQFERFKPVCTSVELGNCSQEELINAYDNTILYTDYILNGVIQNLKGLKEFDSTMIYVSDHGESLGEKNLYLHGIPMSFAPKEQYEIPFIVWLSDNSRKLKPKQALSQNHVFHSVLSFLAIESPIYNEDMNIFK